MYDSEPCISNGFTHLIHMTILIYCTCLVASTRPHQGDLHAVKRLCEDCWHFRPGGCYAIIKSSKCSLLPSGSSAQSRSAIFLPSTAFWHRLIFHPSVFPAFFSQATFGVHSPPSYPTVLKQFSTCRILCLNTLHSCSDKKKVNSASELVVNFGIQAKPQVLQISQMSWNTFTVLQAKLTRR